MLSSELPTLLLVEDNPNNIKVIFNFLKECGFRVLVAKSGENALEKLQDVTPDLILLDVMMPGINGFETCRRIKEDPKNSDIPIIFMTALADTDNKVKGFGLGAVDYITKPFQQEEVLARVKLHLQLRNLTQELASKNEELNQLNASLEQKVEEKTEKIKSMQGQLVLSEKMSSLGQLVAGIAHEINNPINFIAGNLTPASDYAKDLIHLVQLYQKYYPDPTPEIQEELEAIEFEHLVKDFPELIATMKEGTQRIIHISRSMRTFSRRDREEKEKFDLHQGIDSTLLILQHRLKASKNKLEIKVIKDYDNLPTIACFPGQLNQVFMNLLANAIDALEEAREKCQRGEFKDRSNDITIVTRYHKNKQQVEIAITDNGIGMSAQVQQKIFDYLFTTKEIGKGTGLGLSISRQVIVERHGGTIELESTLGEGTTFRIFLPVSH